MRPHGLDDARLDLLGRTIPTGFDVQVVVLAPGCELVTEDDRWQDALIEVEDGEVELALSSDRHRRFGAGDLLVLMDGHLRARPDAPAVVVAVWRTDGSEPDDPVHAVRDEKSRERRLNVHDHTSGQRLLRPER
jgi:hypothetical protein